MISRPQAIAEAEQHAPEILVAVARASAATKDIDVARMLQNPKLQLGSAYQTAHFYTALTAQLPVFGQRSAAVNVAMAAVAAAQLEREVTRVDVRLAASLAWIDLWLVEREVEAAEQTDARRQRLLQATQERYQTGTAPRLDVLRAGVEVKRAHTEALALAQSTAASAARLALWMGRDPSQPRELIAADDGSGSEAALPPLARVLARLDNHPVVARGHAQQRAAGAAVALEKHLRWPLLGVEIGGNFWDPTLPGPDAHAALTFEVPMFHARGPLIARAVAAQGTAQLEAEVAQRRLAAEVAAAYAAAQAAATRAQAQRTELVPAAEEAADLANEAYRAGRLDLSATLAAEQALTDALLSAQRSQADWQRALAALEHTVGGPL